MSVEQLFETDMEFGDPLHTAMQYMPGGVKLVEEAPHTRCSTVAPAVSCHRPPTPFQYDLETVCFGSFQLRRLPSPHEGRAAEIEQQMVVILAVVLFVWVMPPVD